jgi:hypothetical protein
MCQTHVLNIYNCVHIFGIETGREIFNSTLRMRGFSQARRNMLCLVHASVEKQQKSPVPEGSLGHLALI